MLRRRGVGYPLVVLCVLLCAFGIALRLVDLGFPNRLTWDEHHFVENARNYLLGKADWNNHPPLGKFFIALGIHTLGDSSFAFRLPSALFGIYSIVVAGLLARAVFQNDRSGWLAAACVAIDGFMIAYSRTALLDGMLVAFSLSALWLMTLNGWQMRLLNGLVVGCALSIKFSAITLFGPMLAISLLQLAAGTQWGKGVLAGRGLFGKSLKVPATEHVATLCSIPLSVLVFLLVWSYQFYLSGEDTSLFRGWHYTFKLMAEHARLTDWVHPLLSHWWSWWLPTKPIVLSQEETADGAIRMMTTMGNPLLWWSALLALAFSVIEVSRRGLLAAPRWLALPERMWLLLAFVAYLSPWILTNRDTYIYHYLPSHAIALVALGGIAGVYYRGRTKRAVYNGLCVAALVSAFYAPVWAKLPITESALHYRPFVR